MKKMPESLKFSLFLALLGLICAGLLALVNSITSPIIENMKQEELQETLKDVGITKDLKEITPDKYVNGVKKIYSGKDDADKECYVFEVEKSNTYTSFTTLVVFYKEKYLIKTVVVLKTDKITTHNKDQDFINNDFNLPGSTPEDYEDNFANVSGATYSSESVKAAVTSAYLQVVELIKGGLI